MHSQRTILDLVDLVYGATEDDSLWPVFLDKFARTLLAQVGTLYIHDAKSQRAVTDIAIGMDPTYRAAYQANYAAKNVYLSYRKSLLAPGVVATSEELCPDETVLPSEFYNDWVRPQSLRRGLNGVLFNKGSLVGNIGAIRSLEVGPFSGEDKRLLQALMPHMQRSVRLRRRVAELETLERATAGALDRWTMAVLLVDSDSRLITSNRAASELLRRRDGLVIERGILGTARSGGSPGLHRLIREAAGRVTHANARTQDATLVERHSGRRPLQVFVAPCVRRSLFFGMDANALVFVSDPELGQTQTEVLQTLYGLTPAEAAVSAHLAEGNSVKEIADAMTVRENTIRIHLKHVFDKTGTKRQAELVKLVLAGPAALRLSQD